MGHVRTGVLPLEGADIAWRSEGEGPPMLIYNGLVSTWSVHWRAWVAHYATRYTVVTWDFRGHGASPRPARVDSVGIGGFADDGHALIAHLGQGEREMVCGLSMGVQAALEHYRRYPDDVRGLVLLCGTYGHPLRRLSPSPALRAAVVRGLAVASRGGRLVKGALAPLLRTRLPREVAFLTGGAHRGACPPAVLDELFAHVAGMDLDVLTAAIGSYLDHSAEEVLPRIEVPTMLVAGDADQLTPASIAREMNARIRGSSLHVVHGHSHLAQVERPDEVHAAVDGFLARHGFA
jgi:pimeloyl-ACP methyl ester carboxylesterase